MVIENRDVSVGMEEFGSSSIQPTDSEYNACNFSKYAIGSYRFYWVVTRVPCFIFLAVLSLDLLIEYQEKNPATITTYIEYPTNSSIVKVKICNTVFLDPQKILTYNQKEFDLEAYEFLYQAAKGNTAFNDSGWVKTDHMKPVFMISSRVRRQFLREIDQFMVGCHVRETYQSCPALFSYFDESYNPCFEGLINLGGIGLHYAATFFLYYDRKTTMGRYTRANGANVVLAHPEQHTPYVHGSFIGAGDLLTLSGSFILKKQEKAFKNSRCVNKSGLESQNFTGEHFETVYSTFSCGDICFAEKYFEVCGCPVFAGWNITKTECLEKQQYRNCVSNPEVFFSHISEIENCVDKKCWPPCDQKIMDVNPKTTPLNFGSGGLVSLLEEISSRSPETSSLAAGLLQQIKYNDSAEDEISKNFAQLSLYILDDRLITNLEIVQMVSFPTLVGNLGGLLGMWLGLSVISMINFMEGLFNKLFAKKCGAHVRTTVR